MLVAISTDNGQVSPHFGRCPSFTFLEIEGGKLLNRSEIPNPGHETGYIPRFLQEKGVNIIIAGGMGHRAIELFAGFKITPLLGISGSIDDVIKGVLDGPLEGGESLCAPGGGKGYGLPKKDGHGE